MDKVYQILVANRVLGLNSIIPDRYVYTTVERALEDINRRIKAFEDRGEELNYKGIIKNLADIRDIYREHDKKIETNDVYIYEIKVKNKVVQEEITENL